jgi:hypothetical protein
MTDLTRFLVGSVGFCFLIVLPLLFYLRSRINKNAPETGSPAGPCFGIDHWSASIFFSVGFGTCQMIWESSALCG